MTTASLARRTLTGVSAIAALSFAPLHADAGINITEIAPPNTLMVFSIDDFSAARAAFDRTGLRAIWDTPSVQNWFKTSTKEMLVDLDELFEQFGVDREDMQLPTGAFGFAVWMMEDGPNTIDDQAIDYIFIAEYGDRTQAMHALVTEAMERAEGRRMVDVREDTYRDASVLVMKMNEEEEADDDDDFGWDDWDEGGMDIKEVRYARSGNYLVMSGSDRALERAIDRLSGDVLDSLADSDTFRRAMVQVGGGHARAALMTGPIWKKMMDEADDEMTRRMMSMTGIDRIEAVGMAVRLDSEAAMIEQSYGVLMPQKMGIMKLMDFGDEAFSAPAFIGADTAQLFSMRFDFPGVVPLIQNLMANLPQEEAEMAGMMQMVVAGLTPVLQNLGPEVYFGTSYKRPFAPDSPERLTAIRVKDAQTLSNSITQYSGMIGLEARDFMGNQIWSMPDRGMGIPSFAIGMAGGFGFVGPTTTVENAMRQASNPGGVKLADELGFRRAAAAAGNGIMFTFMDTAESLAWMEWMNQNMDRIIRERFAAFADQIPPEHMEQMIDSAKEEMPQWMRSLPPMEDIKRHMGDTVFSVRSTPDGYSGVTRTLRPSAN